MSADMWDQIQAERRSLVAMLEGLDEAQWEVQSLCSEWTVREVAAHVAMQWRRMTLPTALRGLWHSRGDLWGAGGWLAREYAERPLTEIMDELRAAIGSTTHPRPMTPANMRTDLVIHGQDIAVPLCIDRPVPSATASATVDHLWSMGGPFHARKRFAGVRLVATDAAIAVGEGPEVSGRTSDLLLALADRPEGVARLSGPVPSTA